MARIHAVDVVVGRLAHTPAPARTRHDRREG